jgi:hypothetical protein
MPPYVKKPKPNYVYDEPIKKEPRLTPIIRPSREHKKLDYWVGYLNDNKEVVPNDILKVINDINDCHLSIDEYYKKHTE